MTTSVATSREAEGFAALIRSATAQAHQDAERSDFVVGLLDGKLPVTDYALLARQHHVIYAALEEATAINDDPELDRFFAPELSRLDSIESDLEFLAGEAWREIAVSLAAKEYADWIRRVTHEWPRGVLAHHYVRYMGDLSGGQPLLRRLQRIYGFEDGRGTAFYRFDEIPSPQAFKVRYRQMLDDLAWNESEKDHFIDEARLAFDHHATLFADLAKMSESS